MKCNDDSCDLSHCAKCGGHMMGVYLEPGAICDSCTQTEAYLGHRTPEQFKNIFCKVFPEQKRLEIWKGMDFLGFADAAEGEPKITWFIPDGANQFVEITFADIAIIQDNWNQI